MLTNASSSGETVRSGWIAAEERSRIARELHDIVSHSVGTMVVVADGAARTAESDPARAGGMMAQVRDTGREAMVDMRRMLDLLRGDEDADRAPQPGLAKLEQLVRQTRAAGIRVDVEMTGEMAGLPAGADLGAYRIVQESLTNARKHGCPMLGVIRVRVTRSGDEMELRISDDGLGPTRSTERRIRGARPAADRRAGMTIRLVLVDDQEMYRMGFRVVPETRPEFEVVGDADDGDAVIELLRTVEADVVLMDVRMSGMDGVEATRRIRAAGGPRLLVLTTFDLDEYAYDAIQAGASGFLFKDTPLEELAAAIFHVHNGDAVVAPSTTRRLLERFANGESRTLRTDPVDEARLKELTPREQEVMVCMSRGLSNAEIAEHLVIAENAVRVHGQRILTKLGLVTSGDL